MLIVSTPCFGRKQNEPLPQVEQKQGFRTYKDDDNDGSNEDDSSVDAELKPWNFSVPSQPF